MPHIDPADHRDGKTVRTGCYARVNVNFFAAGNMWHITTVDWKHNHPREIPPGGIIPRPPSQQQREVVTRYAGKNFSRTHLASILSNEFPNHPLEPRQVSNMLNAARAEAAEHIQSLGGDVTAVMNSLRAKAAREPGWNWDMQLDENQTVVSLFWQSPVQTDLSRRYHDILINDNSYNRNRYQYPLNIGIIIDGHGKSRNAWYALHHNESTETHNWVFQHHLESARIPPDILASDRHPSIIRSASETLPLTRHIYCLHHLTDNISTNLRRKLGGEWENFSRDFWAVYRAISPTEFDRQWESLRARYPSADEYLSSLYDCRDRWAWYSISSTFTAGVRTNGRSESENRVNKALGGPKKTLLQLFDSLNERTSQQTVDEMVRVREVSHYFLIV